MNDLDIGICDLKPQNGNEMPLLHFICCAEKNILTAIYKVTGWGESQMKTTTLRIIWFASRKIHPKQIISCMMPGGGCCSTVKFLVNNSDDTKKADLRPVVHLR